MAVKGLGVQAAAKKVNMPHNDLFTYLRPAVLLCRSDSSAFPRGERREATGIIDRHFRSVRTASPTRVTRLIVELTAPVS